MIRDRTWKLIYETGNLHIVGASNEITDSHDIAP